MSDVAMRIILEDAGDSAEKVAASAAAGPPLDRTPGPADRTTGPRKSAVDSLGRDLESAAQKVANAFGLGGLTGSAIELRRAFSSLFHSVTDAARAADASRRADISGGRTGEIKTPISQSASPAPSIPRVGTFERQSAKGDVAAPPISRAVTAPIPQIGWWERQAAKGAVAAPPVSAVPPVAAPSGAGVAGAAASAVPSVARGAAAAGPTAGAASAGGGLAGLAAAAGPAAIAVGALTAAVIGGTVAVKKLFDHFHSEADRLSGLSARLSGAMARSDIRAEFADIRRANRVGPGLARVEDTRGKMQEAMTELWTAILEQLLRIEAKFEPMIDLLTAGVNVAAKAAPTIIKGAEIALLIGNPIVQTAEAVAQISKIIRDKLGLADDDKLEDLDDPFMDAFLTQFAGKMDDRERARNLGRARGLGRD